MRNRSCFHSVLLIILFPALIVSTSLLSPNIIFAEETYVFERMWPVLKQPWYFVWVSDAAEDSHGNIYFSARNRILKFTSGGEFITKWGEQSGHIHSIAIDEDDYIYATYHDEHCIRKYNSDGKLLLRWESQNNDEGLSFYPAGIAVDKVGNVYVTDIDNHCIQKFTSDGKFLLKWGSQGSGEDQFYYPTGIAVDGSGNVYITDRGNHRIQKYSSEGNFITTWGSLGSADGELWCPTGIDIDSEGNIYVAQGFYVESYCDCDVFAPQIQKFSPDGQFIKKWGGFDLPIGDGQLHDPTGIIVSKAGVVFVTDLLNWRVLLFDKEGQVKDIWSSMNIGNGQYYKPNAITIDSNGYIYVTNIAENCIQKFNSDFQPINIFYGYSGAIDIDTEGNIYVSYPYYIQKLDPNGQPLISWGGGANKDEFIFTRDIAVDSSGNVYISVADNKIQKYTAVENGSGGYDYVLETEWGTEGSEPGQFNGIYGIDIDAAGNIYAVDSGNGRVQKFSSNGEYLSEIFIGIESVAIIGLTLDNYGNIFVTDWTDRIYKFSPDGQLITTLAGGGFEPGQFQYPSDVAVGSNGSLYVLDMGNNRIQVFTKTQTSKKSKAIIVAGGGSYEGNNLWNATQMCSNFAYRSLTYQGFTKETIHYLTSDLDLDLDGNGEFDDVDGDATNTNLQNAITQWATDADSLVIYLVDHGGEGTFRISVTETLDASDLDAWLDQLQEAIPGKVTVIYDACESGSFISQLTSLEGNERIVIGSTSPGESAYFVTKGSVSFSSFFWTHIFNGLNVKEAFDLATASISNATDYQHPVLDDNGNGIGNDDEDGLLAQNTFIGNGIVIHGDVPLIGGISPDQTINDTNSALLYADNITDTEGIVRVWAVIRPPTYSQQSAYNPVNELPSIELISMGDGRWEGTWDNFHIPGTYHIAIYARDRIGNTSVPAITTVNVNNPITRKAIVVAASWQADILWPSIQKNAQIAYNALKAQGYTEDDLYLMCDQDIPGAVVDGVATVANLIDVLSNWASSATQDLTLYIVVNGNNKSFRINKSENISSEELDGLLDNLQAIIPGEVAIIYDACRSGSFIEDLTPPEDKDRICIASTSSDKPANFLSEGTVSFSQFFWSAIANGSDVYNAFVLGKNAMWYASDGEQTAYLDDNANGIGNEKTDGHIARYYRLGSGIMLAGDEPLIGSVSPEQTLFGEVSATIWAQDVTTTGTIDKVWAVITPPDYNITDPSVPVIDLPTQNLPPTGDGKYEAVYYFFDIAGTYNIVFYAMDMDGNISVPKKTKVIQNVGLAKGDVNGDGTVDLADTVLALQISCGIPPNHIIYHSADVNGNEQIGLEEAVYIIQSVSGLR